MQSVHVYRTGMANVSSLGRGLEVLRILVSAPEPISATQIATEMGLHQSSVSRILTALAADGYVRRSTGRRYEPDFALLGLTTAAARRFDIATQPMAALRATAAQCPGFDVSIGVLWQEEIIYFLRMSHTSDPIIFSSPAFPLHLSAPALRILLDRPRGEALAVLERSRSSHGWERPTPRVPDTAEELLDVAASLVVDDCLVLNMWSSPQSVSAAVPVRIDYPEPLAIAVAGPANLVDAAQLGAWLRPAADAVAQSLS